jgi:hypothetical protein
LTIRRRGAAGVQTDGGSLPAWLMQYDRSPADYSFDI